MKKMFLSIGAVMIFIIFVGLLTRANRGEQNILSGIIKSTPQPAFKEIDLKPLTIGSKQIKVVFAESDLQKQRGLSGIANLPADQGMIFDYKNTNSRPAFWMKDMLIPLDFIWIKSGKVVQIDQNVPNPVSGTKDSELKIYFPSQNIDYILEVNAGFAAKNNIKVGDIVIIP